MQPGSGNTEFKKGDVETNELLIECKDTDASSFSITLSQWDKICQEAAFHQKVPMMAVRVKQKVVAVFDFEDAVAMMEGDDESS